MPKFCPLKNYKYSQNHSVTGLVCSVTIHYYNCTVNGGKKSARSYFLAAILFTIISRMILTVNPMTLTARRAPIVETLF